MQGHQKPRGRPGEKVLLTLPAIEKHEEGCQQEAAGLKHYPRGSDIALQFYAPYLTGAVPRRIAESPRITRARLRPVSWRLTWKNSLILPQGDALPPRLRLQAGIHYVASAP